MYCGVGFIVGCWVGAETTVGLDVVGLVLGVDDCIGDMVSEGVVDGEDCEA